MTALPEVQGRAGIQLSRDTACSSHRAPAYGSWLRFLTPTDWLSANNTGALEFDLA